MASSRLARLAAGTSMTVWLATAASWRSHHYSKQVLVGRPLRRIRANGSTGWGKIFLSYICRNHQALGFTPQGAEGLLVRNGKPLELTLKTTSGNSSRARVAAFLQEQWRHLGIKVVTEFVPARVFFGEVLPRRQFGHMAMFAEDLEFGEVPVAIIDPRLVPTASNGYAGTNYAGCRQPDLTPLLDEYTTSLEAQRRQELGLQITRRYASDLPHLPLFFRTASQVVPAVLENKPGLSYFSGLQSEYWKRHGTTVRPGQQDRLATSSKPGN